MGAPTWPSMKNLEMPAYDRAGGSAWGWRTDLRPGRLRMRGVPANDELLYGTRPPDSRGKAQYVIDLQDFNALAWSCSWCANIALDVDLVAATSPPVAQRARGRGA